MNTIRFVLVPLALALLLQACGAGILYTHTMQPLTTDMHRTPVVMNSAEGSLKEIKINYPAVAWDSDAIGDIAKKNGLHEIYFADLETLKILTIWNQYTIHVYGK